MSWKYINLARTALVKGKLIEINFSIILCYRVCREKLCQLQVGNKKVVSFVYVTAVAINPAIILNMNNIAF